MFFPDKPKKLINVYQPFVAKNTKKYVNDCINNNLYTHTSPYISKFETKIAEYIGVKHCISTFNGSVSLMLILKALGIGPGDEVITQNLTYAATISSIINVGAIPVLIDSSDDYQMNIELIQQAIGPKTKAVMVAGLYGYCCDMVELRGICKSYNLQLIEDAAEVFGCEYGYKMLGSYGIASSFSFYGNKIITTGGEGGCVCTNSDDLATELRLLRGQSHVGNFIHKREGYNFRITAIQAAIGCAQLEHLSEIISRKKEIANLYDKHLNRDLPFSIVTFNSSQWMPLFSKDYTFDYKDFSKHMLSKFVETRPCFTPISLMPGFTFRNGSSLSNSEKIYSKAFNLPCYPSLKNKQLEYIIDVVEKYFS